MEKDSGEIKMKISKELFEAVMGKHFDTIHNRLQSIKGVLLYTNTEITYNDFFFKCKEWAFNNDYMISSTIDSCIVYDRFNEVYKLASGSEQQAVFDACQWILDGAR